jgi:hypothetical protein
MPTTSCAQKGYNCGAIYNGCATEQCGPGPSRNVLGDTKCLAHVGMLNYYACPCMIVLGLDAGAPDGGNFDSGGNVDSGGPIDAGGPPDSGGTPDSGGGMTCSGISAPEPPFPGWQCTPLQTGQPYTSFCCAQ